MAEGFEAYHVPQQSRRDKLRGCADNLPGSEPLLPFYDPSLLSSDLLTCANKHDSTANFMIRYVNGEFIHNDNNNNNNNNPHVDLQSSLRDDNNNNNNNNNNPPPPSSSSYMDLQSSLRINPNNSPILYQSFNGGHLPLSLSLSSNRKYESNVPLELNLHRYECSDFSENDLSRSSVPLGPFTGYASILKGSRFLKPAHQLLEELCALGCGNYGEKVTDDSELMDPTPLVEDLRSSGVEDDGDGAENRRKKSRLVCMLDEMYRKYKQYYQQVQAVVASFETVAGLSSAAPFASLALKAMSKHFRCLKNAITDQLHIATKFHAHTNYSNEETPLYGQRPMQNLGFIDHQPVWRPQRGLPERAVTVLRAWLFEHFLHPYPTDTDKLLLAKQTGLSRNQVSNWFINARVRLWKPMVEEIHTLETRQSQKPLERDHDQQNSNQTNPHFTENLPTSTQRIIIQDLEDLPSKRTRNDDNFPHNPIVSEECMNLLYNTSSRNHIGAGMSSTIGTSGGVSLTLGLHQNNGGVVLSEPFQMNAARRFGLDSSSEGFVMGSFGRDVIGGQLLHDFVG